MKHPGTYNVEFVRAEALQGKYGPCIRFVFKIIDEGEAYDFKPMCITSNVYAPGTKLWNYLKCFNYTPENDRLDLTKLIGKRCVARVDLFEQQQLDGSRRAFWNVKELYPTGAVAIGTTEWKEPKEVARNQTRRFLMRNEDENRVS